MLTLGLFLIIAVMIATMLAVAVINALGVSNVSATQCAAYRHISVISLPSDGVVLLSLPCFSALALPDGYYRLRVPLLSLDCSTSDPRDLDSRFCVLDRRDSIAPHPANPKRH